MNLTEPAWRRATLRFEDSVLEERYDAHSVARTLPLARYGLLAAVAFYAAFTATDVLLAGEALAFNLAVRFLVVIPFLLAVWWLLPGGLGTRQRQGLLFSAEMVAGLGIVSMVAAMPEPGASLYHGGVVLCIFYGYVVFPLRFVYGTVAGILLAGFQIGVCASGQGAASNEVIAMAFYLLSTNLAGMVASWFLERYRRQHFVQITILREQREHLVRLNEALKEKYELERQVQGAQRTRSLALLADGVAHDFNNLLTVIVGNAQLARVEGDEPSRNDNLRRILGASREAADLTRQLLAFSGRSRATLHSLELNSLIESMTKLLRTALSGKAKLVLDLEPHLPPIWGDASLLQQVVMNLVVNASEALGERGGTVGVKTSLEPGSAHGHRQVVLEVSDDGVGMDTATRERVFEPFFTTKFAGRGLGLPAVMGIVRGHDGSIDVSSRQGRGTTIRVRLPVRVSAPHLLDAEGTSAAASKAGPCQGTLLVVEDEEGVRAVCQRMLRHLGLDVITAADGLDAIQTFSSDPDAFDCVILDMEMPRMDGVEALGALRRIRSDLPVIVASGYTEDQVVQRLGYRAFTAFIHKPFELADLEEKLIPILKA